MARTVPAVYYRGGSSKAIFFHENDIPEAGPDRDRFIKRLMGTPDRTQIDGMGGSRVITSKVAIVRRSERADADVEYTFAQVGITDDAVGYNGNCGNISSAVGPFAISEGLVKNKVPGFRIDNDVNTYVVRIYNTGTKKILLCHVPVDTETGEVIESGNFSIAGVPRPGAAILMDYSKTIGAGYGRGILPTSNVIDHLQVGGESISVTICDVANPLTLVPAKQIGLRGDETAEEMNSAGTISTLKEIRGKVAELVGICDDWRDVDRQCPFLPMVATVAYDPSQKGHILSRLILDNRCHDSMAGTAAICTAACSRITGSVVNQLLSETALQEQTLEIHHPLGVMPVTVVLKNDLESSEAPEFNTLSFVRTARRIMTGQLHIPADLTISIPGL